MPTLRPSNPRELLRLIFFSVTLTAATSIGYNVLRERLLIKLRCHAWHFQRSLIVYSEPRQVASSVNTWSFKNFSVTEKPLSNLLQLNLYIHTCRKIKLHQRINGFIRRVNDIHQTLVRADFELVATGFIDVR